MEEVHSLISHSGPPEPSDTPPTHRRLAGVGLVLAVITGCLVYGWLSPSELIVAVALDLLSGFVRPRGSVPTLTRDDGPRDSSP